MKKTLLLILASLVLISSSIAGVPPEINYQGMLQDSSGTAIDGTVEMIFTIYESTTATANLWTETQTAVTVEAGIYNVRLGSITTLPMSVFQDGATKYLGIKVGDDSEMIPRLPMVSVPYAMYASSAESATYAENAKNAENATTADSATTAQSAVTAQTAITAESISTAVDAETVDGLNASTEAKINTLLALNTNASFSLDNSNYDAIIASSSASGKAGIFAEGLSSSSYGINAYHDQPGGVAIKAASLNNGIAVQAIAGLGNGIAISAEATGINGIAMRGVATGFWGSAFTGIALNSDPGAYTSGGDFESNAETGFGITAKATGNQGIGVKGESTAANGIGVYAKNISGGTALKADGKLNVVGTLEVAYDVRLGSKATVPSIPTSAGTKGWISFDGTDPYYLYICVDTNIWRRVTLETW